MGRPARRSGALGVLLCLGFARAAHAEEPAAAGTSAAEKPSVSHYLELPQVPSLRLTWPVAPLRFSFSGSEEGNYANGPLRLFRAESLWLHTPSFQLLTIGSAERDFELDCSGLTCQPVVKSGVAVEARLALPRFSGAVPSTYAYVRGSSYRTPQPMSARSGGLISAGFAGTLDF
ncbi:MAG TPA: hypothetical protein VHP33_34005 [Polyangiaceae bacterium]|nr:hypothetical protein [Polyangiaceae bacterium]